MTTTITRLPLLDQYLREQHELTAVERFARSHDAPSDARRYQALLPATPPGEGQQYAFEVDLDACSGCKSCVTACHNLNGLDEGETWRVVGLLHGGSAAAAVKQVVTSACHHCLEPACLSGCPVAAYEKDLVTGIVKHLDDQCIGCQYCTFTCPYEVPQYNARRGIVRKCDMCSDRLAVGEAPACVQACPTEAIAITVIDKRQALEDAQGDAFLPGTPSPAITIPTTVYKTQHPPPRNLLPAEFFSVSPSHHHAPLVVMLVLTQLSVGAFVADAVIGRSLAAELRAALQPAHALGALAVGLAALLASVFHLGRPLYAFRAVIGLRTSWMSREIVAFGLFAPLAMAYAAASFLNVGPREALGWTVAALGTVGIACSVMIYHATRKAWWTASITGFKFFMTAAVLGLATSTLTMSVAGVALRELSLLVVIASAIKAVGELSVFVHLRDRRYTELKRSALLMTTDLRNWAMIRFCALGLGGIMLPLTATSDPSLEIAIASLALLVIGELCERVMFFAAASSPGMPKGLR
ncbi:MAG: dimethyl sulfoxide reductase anchor subunit [Deltaproteobacteria bacterium]|nr:dimethyl sulfoxide reductase anchor subunit [Deltaproteobacteria bacterium]